MTKETQSTAEGAYNLFVGNLVSTAVLGIATIVAARLLKPSGFGLFTVALIVPSYIVLVITLGLSTAATRFAAKYQTEGLEQKAVSVVFSLSVLEFVLSIAAILVVIPFSNVIATDILHRPELSQSIILISALSASGISLYNVLVAGLYGLGRYYWSAILQVVQSVVRSVVAIGLILIGLGVLGAVAGYAVGMSVSGVVGFVMIFLLRGKTSFLADFKADVKGSLSYSAPVYIGSILNGAVAPVTNTVLAYFVTNYDLGGYSAAVNLSVIVTLFLFPISTVFLPIFSRVGDDSKRLSETYRTTVKFSTLFIVPVAVFVIAFSSSITSVIYGTAYQFAGLYLALLVITPLLSGVGAYTWGPALTGIGETRSYLISLAPGALVTLVSVAALVKFMGVSGSIIAGISGQVVSLAVAHFFLKSKMRGEKDLDYRLVWKIYVSSGLAVCVPLLFLSSEGLFEEHPFIAVVVAAILFLGALVPIMALTKTISEQDIETLESSFSKTRFVGSAFHLLVRYYRLVRLPT